MKCCRSHDAVDEYDYDFDDYDYDDDACDTLLTATVTDTETNAERIATQSLSPVGRAVYECLRTHHEQHRRVLWNVSTGAVVGPFQSTPAGVFAVPDAAAVDHQDDDDEGIQKDSDGNTTYCPSPLPPIQVKEGHDDWFPRALADMVATAERFVDVLSLREPDGLFLTEFRRAVTLLASKPRFLSNSNARSNSNTQSDTKKYPEASSCITIRLMFGNVLGWPVDCERVVQELTRDILLKGPPALPRNNAISNHNHGNNKNENNIRLWVGAWRKHVSWNHAKILAVDGRTLHTGGHNFWSQHYLKENPLHDISMQLEGAVAEDGHRFANAQWAFVREDLRNRAMMGKSTKLPHRMRIKAGIPFRTNCTLASYPSHTATTPVIRNNRIDDAQSRHTHPSHGMPRFPPMFSAHQHAVPCATPVAPAASPPSPYHPPLTHVPILTMGKAGSLVDNSTSSSNKKSSPHRPSDDGLVALLNAAQHHIQIATQDLGPRCLPLDCLGCGSCFRRRRHSADTLSSPQRPKHPPSSSFLQIPYPGTGWPTATLDALAHAIWYRGVRVDVVLAHPGAICGGCAATDTLARPNGWTLVQVRNQVVTAVHRVIMGGGGVERGPRRHPSHRPPAAFNDYRQNNNTNTNTNTSTPADHCSSSKDAAHIMISDWVDDHLFLCHLRHGNRHSTYADGTPLGLHAKCYIVDGVTFYVGSQNLYICDLAEWGAVVDDASTTARLRDEYWNPMWKASWEHGKQELDDDDDDDDDPSACAINPTTQTARVYQRSKNAPTGIRSKGEYNVKHTHHDDKFL